MLASFLIAMHWGGSLWKACLHALAVSFGLGLSRNYSLQLATRKRWGAVVLYGEFWENFFEADCIDIFQSESPNCGPHCDGAGIVDSCVSQSSAPEPSSSCQYYQWQWNGRRLITYLIDPNDKWSRAFSDDLSVTPTFWCCQWIPHTCPMAPSLHVHVDWWYGPSLKWAYIGLNWMA